MQLNDVLVSTKKSKKRVGRGGRRGTTSGRGTKGQKARAGRKIRPAIRDLIKKIPKKRGVKFKKAKTEVLAVDFDILSKSFNSGEKVSPRLLDKKGLISLPNRGVDRVKVKVLNRGELTKKLIFENINVSQEAAEKIFALGGEVRQVSK